MKVAIIHDWLIELGGAESVLKELVNLYSNADIYTLVFNSGNPNFSFLKNRIVRSSFIQRLPGSLKNHRKYLALMPLAIEQFDLSDYDLVISSSYCVAKGVLTGPGQLHVCYCHSPVRYAWDLQHQYLEQSGLSNKKRGVLARLILHYIRLWDVRTSNSVDCFIANSNFIAKRIKKVYGRKSLVIHPPVAVEEFNLELEKEDYYLVCSRLVPYKKIDVIVSAFNRMPDKKLFVIGNGPEMKKLKSLAKDNTVLLGFQPFETLKEYMEKAKAFVFAAEEDFGIVPLEAQASGTPVIGYGKGGLLETVVENVTGVFFHEQSPQAIMEAIWHFETMHFDYLNIRKHSENFSTSKFTSSISTFIDDKVKESLESC
ncbi:glycosyltransferase family 4 protein [Alteromonas gracilis]|uniref:glycosyltransferase family 4 protein n=1 Tax=Alteromonas gracilis TaxID=1479524 RepID=UPI002FE385D3